jgi:hypothetical protein
MFIPRIRLNNPYSLYEISSIILRVSREDDDRFFTINWFKVSRFTKDAAAGASSGHTWKLCRQEVDETADEDSSSKRCF